MRNLSELGLHPSFGGGWPPPPTPKQIEAFENHFKVKLPDTYLEFLSISKGGVAKVRGFKVAETGEVTSMDVIFCLSERNFNRSDLWQQMKIMRPYIGPKAVPIGDDGMGNLVVLDFSDQPPSVKFWDHDQRRGLKLIASSFEQFIDGLFVYKPFRSLADSR